MMAEGEVKSTKTLIIRHLPRSLWDIPVLPSSLFLLPFPMTRYLAIAADDHFG